MNVILHQDKLDVGLIGIQVINMPTSREHIARVHIRREGEPEYHYKIRNENKKYYPLPHGNGKYVVEVIGQTSLNVRNTLLIKDLYLNVPNPDIVFTQPNVNMDYNSNDVPIIIAKTIPNFQDITKFISQHFSYNHYLANEIRRNNGKYDYVPDIQGIWNNKKDICFGLTSLLNSMLRSVGIPAKMIHGYVKFMDYNYHCWSEVYIDGNDFAKSTKQAVGFTREIGPDWMLYDITMTLQNRQLLDGFQNRPNYMSRFVY